MLLIIYKHQINTFTIGAGGNTNKVNVVIVSKLYRKTLHFYIVQ